MAVRLDATSLAAELGAVWVAGVSTVTKIDAATGQELGQDSIPSSQFAEIGSIALSSGAVWYTRSSDETLWRIEPESATTAETFSVGSAPSDIAVDAEAVWVACSGDGTVSRVDSTSGETIPIGLGSAPGGIVAAYGAIWTSPGEPRA